MTGWIIGWAAALATMAGSSAALACGITQAESTSHHTAASSADSSKGDPKQAKKMVALGDQLAKGQGVPRDESKASRLYQEAAELGDPVGKMRFGEALVFGRGVAVDQEQGIRLIKTAAEGGNSAALVLLADLHMRGLLGSQERVRAVKLLEDAAARGQLVALVKLGGIYQSGDLVKRDAAKAATYYRKAIELGRADAMVALGRALVEGKLRGQGSRSEGISLLKRAQDLNNQNAVVVLSESYIYGRGVKRNPKLAIELLKAASGTGNTKASLQLVTLYRDGRKRIIPRDLPVARATLDEIAGKLSPLELKAERLLLGAADLKKADYPQLQAEFDNVPAESRPSLLRRIRGTSGGLYIYLVQTQLERLNIYKGPKNGRLSRATIRAIHRHCLRHEQSNVCRKGPLTPRTIEVTAMAFEFNHADSHSTMNEQVPQKSPSVVPCKGTDFSCQSMTKPQAAPFEVIGGISEVQ